MLTRMKQIAFTSAAKLMLTGAGAGVAVVAAQHFGQAGLGIYALARTIPAMLTVITDPGLSHAVPYLINNQKNDARRVFSVTTVLYCAVAVVQVLVWLALALLIKERMFMDLSLSAVVLLAIAVPALSFQILIVNMLRTADRMGAANLISATTDIATLMIMSATWILNIDRLDTIPIIHVVSCIITLIVGALVLGIVPKVPDLLLLKSLGRQAFAFGIKSQVGSAFQILNYRLDHLLIGLFLSTERVAIYFVATKAAELFRFFSASVVFVLEPVVAGKAKGEASDGILRMMLPVFLVNLLLVAAGSVLMSILIPTIFGAWAREAILPMYILVAGLIVSGANSLFGAYYLGQGKPGINTLASVFGMLATAGLGLLLIPSFGAIGAAITSSIAYTLVTAAYWWHFIFVERKGSGDASAA